MHHVASSICLNGDYDSELKLTTKSWNSAKPLLTAPNSKDMDTNRTLDVMQMSICGNTLTQWAVSKHVEQNLTNEPYISEISCNTMSSLSDDHVFFVEEPPSPDHTYEQDVADIEDFPFIYGNLDDFTDDLLKAGNITRANENCSTDDVSFTHGTDKQGYSVFGSSVHPESNHFTTNTFSHEWTNESSSMNSERLKNQIMEGCTLQAIQADFPNPQIPSSVQAAVNYGKDIMNTIETASDDIKTTSAIVPLPSGAHLPAPKLKNISRLRTIHYVYANKNIKLEFPFQYSFW